MLCGRHRDQHCEGMELMSREREERGFLPPATVHVKCSDNPAYGNTLEWVLNDMLKHDRKFNERVHMATQKRVMDKLYKGLN